MKNLNEYILSEAKRKNKTKQYVGQRIPIFQDLETSLNNILPTKSFDIFIENTTDKIKLDVTRNFKEGIVGHLMEDIIAETIINSNLSNFTVKKEKKDGADLTINGEPVEIKAFSRKFNQTDGHVEKGITFSPEQMKGNGCAMILAHYNINNEKILIDKVFCRYPDEVYWGDTTITVLKK